jgi:hypothetical protein
MGYCGMVVARWTRGVRYPSSEVAGDKQIDCGGVGGEEEEDGYDSVRAIAVWRGATISVGTIGAGAAAATTEAEVGTHCGRLGSHSRPLFLIP